MIQNFITNNNSFSLSETELYSYIESTYSGYTEVTLIVCSLIAVLCGMLVIISVNPIISVLFLIGLFLSIAAYLIIIGINFIGLSYLLVYVGAVSILFLFILMLINIRISELFEDTNKSIPLSIITAIFFNSIIFTIIPYNVYTTGYLGIYSGIKEYLLSNTFNYSNVYENNDIQFVTSSSWDSYLGEVGGITGIGSTLYSIYSIWLILTSVILLLAMVGAIIITISPKVNFESSPPKPHAFIQSSLHSGIDLSWIDTISKTLIEIMQNNIVLTETINSTTHYLYMGIEPLKNIVLFTASGFIAHAIAEIPQNVPVDVASAWADLTNILGEIHSPKSLNTPLGKTFYDHFMSDIKWSQRNTTQNLIMYPTFIQDLPRLNISESVYQNALTAVRNAFAVGAHTNVIIENLDILDRSLAFGEDIRTALQETLAHVGIALRALENIRCTFGENIYTSLPGMIRDLEALRDDLVRWLDTDPICLPSAIIEGHLSNIRTIRGLVPDLGIALSNEIERLAYREQT